jgi:hypothetical protein
VRPEFKPQYWQKKKKGEGREEGREEKNLKSSTSQRKKVSTLLSLGLKWKEMQFREIQQGGHCSQCLMIQCQSKVKAKRVWRKIKAGLEEGVWNRDCD